jgi:hypothetical protein
MVALLLKAEDKDDIRAAIMTAIIRPTRPDGNTFSTSLIKRSEKGLLVNFSILQDRTMDLSSWPWIYQPQRIKTFSTFS